MSKIYDINKKILNGITIEQPKISQNNNLSNIKHQLKQVKIPTLIC